jgi:hypothetical protein
VARNIGLDRALLRSCGRNLEGTPTLGCGEAFALAARFSMPIEEFGRLCNERGIKIVKCRLGCFA